MDLAFFQEVPALMVKRTQKVLVVADLHFGIESGLVRQGVHLRSRSEERLARIVDLVRKAGPDLLLLLGDIKHTVPGMTRQEFLELPAIFGTLRSLTAFAVVPGNHDPGIARFLHAEELFPADGVVIDGIAYLHGHTLPAPAALGRLMITGHHHPVVAIRDEVGCSLCTPAYLMAEIEEKELGVERNEQSGSSSSRVLMVPAANEYSGYDLLMTVKKPFSPLSRCIRKDSAEVFLTDGTYVCRLTELGDDGTSSPA